MLKSDGLRKRTKSKPKLSSISHHSFSICLDVPTFSFHFISFHFISFHFISFHFISFHFVLPLFWVSIFLLSIGNSEGDEDSDEMLEDQQRITPKKKKSMTTHCYSINTLMAHTNLLFFVYTGRRNLPRDSLNKRMQVGKPGSRRHQRFLNSMSCLIDITMASPD